MKIQINENMMLKGLLCKEFYVFSVPALQYVSRIKKKRKERKKIPVPHLFVAHKTMLILERTTLSQTIPAYSFCKCTVDN